MVFGGKKFEFAPQTLSNLLAFDTSSSRQLLNSLDSSEGNGSTDNTSWCKMSQLKSSTNARAGGEKVLEGLDFTHKTV
jgi:hypothetical protein